MKSIQILLVPILAATGAHADILSQSSPFLGASAPAYDPVAAKPDVAVEDPSYAPFSPADSDLGVQQILGTYGGLPPVQFTLDASLNYTNNAPGDTRAQDGESWYFASSLAASWRPRIAWGWFADLGLTTDLFAFERSEAVDFEGFEPYIGAVKTITELDDLLVFARYEYQRIWSDSQTDGNYWANRIHLGTRKNLLLTSLYQLSAGLDTGFDLSANEDRLERDEYGADLSFTWWFADRLSSTLSWRGSYWDFRDNGREDWNNIIGLELTWTPCENARVYSNVFYTNHNSDTASDADDFEAWQSGIGVGLNYSF